MTADVIDPPAPMPTALIGLAPLAGRAPAALRALTALHADLYQRTHGRVLGRWFGGNVLVLHTVGRRTRRPRATPLVYLRDGTDLVVVAANGGAPRHPDWWLNLRDAGHGVVVVGRDDVPVQAREATGPDRDRLWRGLAAHVPVDHYQRRTARPLPVVVLTPKEMP